MQGETLISFELISVSLVVAAPNDFKGGISSFWPAGKQTFSCDEAGLSAVMKQAFWAVGE